MRIIIAATFLFVLVPGIEKAQTNVPDAMRYIVSNTSILKHAGTDNEDIGVPEKDLRRMAIQENCIVTGNWLTPECKSLLDHSVAATNFRIIREK